MIKLAIRTVALLFGAIGLPSWALADDAARVFSINGFGTIGAVHNSTAQADFIRDFSQTSGAGYSRRLDFGVDSRLGVQLNARASDTLDGAVQVVSHRRYDGSFRPELNWAFVKYAPSDSMQLRAGRLGLDLYMLADSRHIGYSHFLVRPPVDYFGTLPISYIDGADLVLKRPLGDGIARAKFYVGSAREKMRSTADTVYDAGGSQGIGFNGEYQRQAWLYRLGYGQIRMKNELPSLQPLLNALRSPSLSAFGPGPATFAEDVKLADQLIRFYSAGAVYDSGPFQAQLVLSRLNAPSLSFPSTDAGYFTLAYRSREWMPYFAYAAIRSRAKRYDTGLPQGVDPNFDAINAGAALVQAINQNKQHTVSLGVRYDFMRNADIKFQVDRVHAGRPYFWRNIQPGWDGRATLVSVTLDFVF